MNVWYDGDDDHVYDDDLYVDGDDDDDLERMVTREEKWLACWLLLTAIEAENIIFIIVMITMIMLMIMRILQRFIYLSRYRATPVRHENRHHFQWSTLITNGNISLNIDDDIDIDIDIDDDDREVEVECDSDQGNKLRPATLVEKLC